MKRKLLLLNALLCGVAVLAGAELYSQWLEGEQRSAQLDILAPDAVPPAYPEPPRRASIRQVDFLPVVDRLLFSADRNAIVEVAEPEIVEVKKPELPLMLGLIDFGDGLQALMADDANATLKWIGVGEKVGEFVFQGMDGDKVKLSWNEEELVVKREELVGAKPKARKEPARAARASAPPAPGAPPAADLTAAARKSVGGDHNIGPEFAPGRFRADPKDAAPDGTEYKGYVKTVRATPFGSQSWWGKKE